MVKLASAARIIQTPQTLQENAVPGDAVSRETDLFTTDELFGVKHGQYLKKNRSRVLADMETLFAENRWQDIVSLYHPVEEKVPELVKADMADMVREKIAFAFGQLKQFDEAIAQLQVCIDHDPGNYYTRSSLAYTAYSSLFAAQNREIFLAGKPRALRMELAHDNFNRAREMRPDGVTNFYRQAMLYARIQNKTTPALNLLEKAVANWEALSDQEKDRRHQEKKNYVKSLYRSASILLETGEASRALELNPLVEISGAKGFHFWFFSDPPVQASAMRKTLASRASPLAKDLSCFDLEVFPKQDSLTGKEFGNLVKLPLGVHRLSGKRSYFPGCVQKDAEAQLAFLEQVKPSLSRIFESGPDTAAPSNLVLHPEMKALTKEYPGLFDIQQNCPPLGQIIALAREGRNIPVREEKILFQTLGFLPQGKKILHFLLQNDSEYNPHMVDYKLSRLRGTPLGCRRIHSLTGFTGSFCDLTPDSTGYIHPLIPVAAWQNIAEKKTPVSEKIQNLTDAIDNLKTAIRQVERFLA